MMEEEEEFSEEVKKSQQRETTLSYSIMQGLIQQYPIFRRPVPIGPLIRHPFI